MVVKITQPPQFTSEQLLQMVMDDQPRKPAKCKHCGKGNLQWVAYQFKGADRWVLVQVQPDGSLIKHFCPEGTAQNGPMKYLKMLWNESL